MEVIKKYLFKNPLATKSSAIFILAVLFWGTFIPLEFASASIHGTIGNAFGIFGDVAGGFVLSILSIIPSFLVPVAAFFAGAAGSFLHWTLNDMPFFYTKCTAAIPPDQCFIDIGWRLARDIVNIALIVAIVIIALFTILGSENYGARKALVPFIVIAIIINFSRVIVGTVVDISNIVMGVFVAAMPTFSDIGSLVSSTGVSLGELTFKTDLALNNLLSAITSILFFMGLALILALYGIIFAVRFGALWMLTIMSPIALAAWIFPSTKKIFTFWKDQLIQWSVIGIPILFFLWIALMFSSNLEQIKPAATSLGSLSAENFFVAIIPKLMSLLLLYVAFAFGMKTSAMGSSMVINTTKKWGRAAGTAAGRMAWRGAVVGARKAGPVAGRGLRGAVRKIGGAPPLRAVGAWRLGAVRRRYDKNPQNREKMLRRSRLWGRTDRNGRAISENTPWGALTAAQQDRIVARGRLRPAKKAARLLGGGAKRAKRIASLPFEALTPEEQKALWSAVTFERIRKAKKKDVSATMENLKEKGFDDPESLKRTITRETSPSKRLAAQILLSEHSKDFEDFIKDPKERGRIVMEAKRVGKENDILSNLGANTVKDLYKDPVKQAEKMRKAMDAANKKIEEAYKSMTALGETNLRNIMNSATSFHDRVAAARHLADSKKLSEQDFAAIKNTAKNFEQYQYIAKRYLQFADAGEIPDIVKKMSKTDYRNIDKGILDPVNKRANFEAFYGNANTEGFTELLKDKGLRETVENLAASASKDLLKSLNSQIHQHMAKMSGKAFGIQNWPT